MSTPTFLDRYTDLIEGRVGFSIAAASSSGMHFGARRSTQLSVPRGPWPSVTTTSRRASCYASTTRRSPISAIADEPLFQSYKGRMNTVIADSSFNAAELRDAGIGEATVVPLLLDLPDEVSRRGPSRQPVVLTVGRVVPNKRLEDVIQGVHPLPAPSRIGGVARDRGLRCGVRALPPRA